MDQPHGDASTSQQFRAARRVCLLVLASSFGPYLLPSLGLRPDQLVVYALLVGTCAAMLMGREVVMKRPMWAILALWTAAAVLMLCTSLMFGEAPNLRAVLAALDAQTLSIATLIVLGAALCRLSHEESHRLVGWVAASVVVLMCANAALAVTSIYIDTTGVISHFITIDAVGSSVSSRAASMGRYSGIFNQPIEAGLAYSTAVLAWVYLLISRGVRSRVLGFGLVLLVVGGLLTVSKVFVLGGLPLALVYGLWEVTRGHHSRISRLLFWGGFSVVTMISLGGWSGWGFLTRLFLVWRIDPSGVMGVYSAGRYGQAGISVQGLFERTMLEAPLRGFGLGSHAPLDSGYMEFLYQGGMVALSLYIGVLIVLLVNALRSASSGIAEGRLQLLLWVVIVGGNFGASSLTANRASTILWVLLLPLMHTSWRAERQGEPTCGGPDGPGLASARLLGWPDE